MDEGEANTNSPTEDKSKEAELKDNSGIVLSPKPQAIIGAVPGVPVGTLFGNRIHLRFAGIHRPPMAGICGNGKHGAESIVLNSGYEDDVDEGDTIIYTGAGANQGGKQVADQELTGTNAALVKSEQLDLPVRVVRGSKLKSDFAAPYGFRYDGLYRVVEHYKTVGTSGFAVWQFKMTRLPDQPELPKRLSEKELNKLAAKLKKQFDPILKELRSVQMSNDNEGNVKTERGVKSEKKVKRELKRARDDLDGYDGLDHEIVQPRKRRRTIGGDLDDIIKHEKRRRGPGQPLPYQYRGYPGLKLATLPTWKLVSIILRGYCPLCVKLLFNCDVPVLHITENNYLELASALDHARLQKAINHLIEHQMYIKELALRVETELDPLEQLMSQHLMNQIRVRSFIEGLDDKDYSHTLLDAQQPVEIPKVDTRAQETTLRGEYSDAKEGAVQSIEDVQYLFANDRNVYHDYFTELNELAAKEAELFGSESGRAISPMQKPTFTTEVINVIDDESENNNNIIIVDGYTLFVSNKWDQNSMLTSGSKPNVIYNKQRTTTTTDNTNNKPNRTSHPVTSNLSLYDVIVVEDDEDEYAYQNKLIEEISSSEEEEQKTTKQNNIFAIKSNGVHGSRRQYKEKQMNNENSSKKSAAPHENEALPNNNNLAQKHVNNNGSLFNLDSMVMDDND